MYFKNIEEEKSTEDWYHCFLREGRFEGAGGSCNLIDILYVFQKWVQAHQGEFNKDFK